MAVAWFLLGSATVGWVLKFYSANGPPRTLLAMLIALTLSGTALMLVLVYDDWRLHHK